MKKILQAFSILGIVAGTVLLSIKIYSSLQYQTVEATVVSMEQSAGACRRRTGKIEVCRHFDLHVSYNPFHPVDPSDEGANVPLQALLTVEARNFEPVVGEKITAFVNKNDLSDIRVDVLREGWKTPLSILTLSLLSLLIIRLSLQKSKKP